MVSVVSRKTFLSYFESAKQHIVKHILKYSGDRIPTPAIDWVHKVLDYSVPKGNLLYGLRFVSASNYMSLDKSSRKYDLATTCQLGWACEMYVKAVFVSDDFMDLSPTRSGQKSWHLLEDVGPNAVNDSMMIENASDIIVHGVLSNQPTYLPVLSILQEAKLLNTLGQHLDTLKPNLEKVNHRYYSDLVRHKTGYLLAPSIMMALHLHYDVTPSLDDQVREICFMLSHFGQAQNDFLDCYGDPNVTGKIGNDIENSRCTWLLAEALKCIRENSSGAADFKVLKENYGKNADVVKKLYEKLRIQDRFAQFQNDQLQNLKDMVNNLPSTVDELKPFFYTLYPDPANAEQRKIIMI